MLNSTVPNAIFSLLHTTNRTSNTNAIPFLTSGIRCSASVCIYNTTVISARNFSLLISQRASIADAREF